MPRVRQPHDVARVVVAGEPPERGQHVLAGREEGRAAVLGRVGHDHHVMALGREATLLYEEVPHVHTIVDAAIQLVLGAEIVDPDQECLSAGHLFRGVPGSWGRSVLARGSLCLVALGERVCQYEMNWQIGTKLADST
jgi:hypothetical protein